MATFEYVDFVIDEDGSMSAEVFGAKGPDCTTLLDQLLAKFGGVTHRKRKQSYYQRARQRIAQAIGGRRRGR